MGKFRMTGVIPSPEIHESGTKQTRQGFMSEEETAEPNGKPSA